jgi:hypothetical protein
LAALRRGPTTIDLSGASSFAAGGLVGTARSTIVLHVQRLQGGKVHTQPPPTSISNEDRVITVHYKVVKVAGSVAVNVAGSRSTCAGFDVCRLAGTLTLHPGPAHGEAYVVAHDLATTSGARLRSAVGLAPGPIPKYAQVFGLTTLTSKAGSVSETLDRDGAVACRDSTPLPVSAVEIAVDGKRATATFGGADFAELPPIRDLLRTRCPGPTAADLTASNRALATIAFPVTVLARRTITLHFSRAITIAAAGFSWSSRPSLTIVLRRTRVTERLVPSSDFQT